MHLYRGSQFRAPRGCYQVEATDSFSFVSTAGALPQLALTIATRWQVDRPMFKSEAPLTNTLGWGHEHHNAGPHFPSGYSTYLYTRQSGRTHALMQHSSKAVYIGEESLRLGQRGSKHVVDMHVANNPFQFGCH